MTLAARVDVLVKKLTRRGFTTKVTSGQTEHEILVTRSGWERRLAVTPHGATILGQGDAVSYFDDDDMRERKLIRALAASAREHDKANGHPSGYH